MHSFQITVKATVPEKVQENGSVLRYAPKRYSGLVMTLKKKMTIAEAGKEAADRIKAELLEIYPNVNVEVVKAIKLKDDFIFKIES